MRSPRRPERFEVVVGGETHAVVVGVDGEVRAGGDTIGTVENTGRKIPRTSRWRARDLVGKTAASGYTAEDAAVALAYVVLRAAYLSKARARFAKPRVSGRRSRRDPPEDVCSFCRAARDRCGCDPSDFRDY